MARAKEHNSDDQPAGAYDDGSAHRWGVPAQSSAVARRCIQPLSNAQAALRSTLDEPIDHESVSTTRTPRKSGTLAVFMAAIAEAELADLAIVAIIKII
jgi:hypothetical protein